MIEWGVDEAGEIYWFEEPEPKKEPEPKQVVSFDEARFKREQERIALKGKGKVEGWFKQNNNQGSLWKFDMVLDNHKFLKLFRGSDAREAGIKEYMSDLLRAIDNRFQVVKNENNLRRNPYKKTKCLFVVEDRDKDGNPVFPHLHLIFYFHPKFERVISNQFFIDVVTFERTKVVQVSNDNETEWNKVCAYHPDGKPKLHTEKIPTPLAKYHQYGKKAYVDLGSEGQADRFYNIYSYNLKNHTASVNTDEKATERCWFSGEVNYS